MAPQGVGGDAPDDMPGPCRDRVDAVARWRGIVPGLAGQDRAVGRPGAGAAADVQRWVGYRQRPVVRPVKVDDGCTDPPVVGASGKGEPPPVRGEPRATAVS